MGDQECEGNGDFDASIILTELLHNGDQLDVRYRGISQSLLMFPQLCQFRTMLAVRIEG